MLVNYGRSHNPQMQGIFLMICSCFYFAAMTAVGRHLPRDIHPFIIVFFRNVFSAICVIPWAYSYGFNKIRTNRWRLYAIRVVTGLVGISSIYYAISIMPITQVTALTFTVPLITVIFAVIFLGEKPQAHKWIALIAGFIGILVILLPGTNEFNIYSLLVLLTTCCWSVSNILIKKLTSTDDPKTIVILMTTAAIPFSFPFAILFWKTPNLEQLLLLLLLGWLSNQAQILMTLAYSKTDMGTLLPFDFSRLIFVSIFAYVFFGEVIDTRTATGAIMIFCSGCYLAIKEKNK